MLFRSVLKSESRVEAPGKEKSNMGSGEALTSVDGSTSIVIAKKSQAVNESVTTSENLNQSTPTADKPNDKVTITITLADIASQCQNYTETGFALYAETIKGALFSGNALMVAMSPDSSEAGTFSIDLTNSQFDSSVIVNLRKVPEEVARMFEEGGVFGITGIVVDSKVVGLNCSVGLIYQPATG